MFRVNGKPAIGLAIAMRDGGDILTLGRNVKKAIDESVANLPLGIDASLVSDQPVVVQTAIGEFMESLWQAIAIIMAVSIISLGLSPGSVVALTIPLTIAIVFPIMQAMHIDLQRISLGALIISLSLLVDSAMTAIDVMTTRLAQGDSKEEAASFAYKTLALPMLTGTFVTIAGFVPIGFARSAAGEYTFSIFAVVTIALVVSWFVAVLFAPLLGAWILKKPDKPAAAEPNFVLRTFRSILVGAMRMRWITIAVTLACFAAALLALPYVPRQFFPASDRPELVVDLTLPQNASIFAQRRRLRQARRDAERRSRRRELEHLCRARRDPLLPAPRRQAAQRLLLAGRGDRQGRRGARPAAREAREGAGRAAAERGRARVAARARSPGRLAGAISGERARPRRKCARSRSSSARRWARTPICASSISTGWSLRVRSGSVSTRIRRACLA